MDISVTRSVLRAILAEAARAAPEEACGLLLGRGGRVRETRPTANCATDRLRHFEIEPQALIDAHRAARAGGPQVVGYYHSHPAGAAEPSVTDRALAGHDGRVWAIAAKGAVTFWRDEEAGFVPLSYAIEDR